MSEPPNAATDPTAFQLFNEVGIINQLASTRFARALPDGLTASQFFVLNHFVRLGGERAPSELARAFQVTKAAMTNTLTKLESKGLVRIKPSSEDGRAKVVTITAKGRRMRERGIKTATASMADVAVFLHEQTDVAALLEPLRQIREYLDNHRTDGT